MGTQIRFTKINSGFGANFDFSVVGAHFSVVGSPLFSAAENTDKSGRSRFRGRKWPRDFGGPGGGWSILAIFSPRVGQIGAFRPSMRVRIGEIRSRFGSVVRVVDVFPAVVIP
jgi:hypothetical protein